LVRLHHAVSCQTRGGAGERARRSVLGGRHANWFDLQAASYR
jgi:hypothetical protein